ncbi:MAG TPA: hypothetical protein DIV60_07780 [Oscillibacter sp.]|nr:hypothetical protein [Oscillibacter sp.]
MLFYFYHNGGSCIETYNQLRSSRLGKIGLHPNVRLQRPDAQARHRAQKPRRHTEHQGRHLGRHRRAAGGRGGARGQLPRQARGPARDDGGQRRDGIRPLAGRHDQGCGAVRRVQCGRQRRN